MGMEGGFSLFPCSFVCMFDLFSVARHMLQEPTSGVQVWQLAGNPAASLLCHHPPHGRSYGNHHGHQPEA